MAGRGNAHPLMRNNIVRDDLDHVIEYLSKPDPRLTQGANVKAFEEEWSKWLGVKYSVFVNSGSSANLMSMSIIKNLYGDGDVIVPPITWVSDIVAVLHNQMTPIFVDINPRHLGMDNDSVIDSLTEKTKCVFLTHVQGFNGLTRRLLDELERRGIPLVEDVCESHGATFDGQRLGSYGFISNFSFYYAHHMSTIEGGMVCTNNEDVYQMLRMYRSHGMVREIENETTRDHYASEFPDLNPDFIFAYPGFNFRNNEIGAIIGRNQLKRLDNDILKRSKNHNLFISNLNSKRFRTNFLLDGSSNYAFNVILNEPDIGLRDRLEAAMEQSNIEYRRGSAGGGNQVRQPYLRAIVDAGDWLKYPEAEHIHFFGWYVGNYPDLSEDEIRRLCRVLNEV